MKSRFQQIIGCEKFQDSQDCPDFPEIDRLFLVNYLTDSLNDYEQWELWGEIRENGKTILSMTKDECGFISID